MPKLFRSAPAAAASRPFPSLLSSAEALESRQLMTVVLDAAGYTVVTPERGDRVVYVSSSAGSDDNDGLSADHPVRSLSAGADRLRDGTGDQLLLKRGDTWRSGLPGWRKSGASADEPMVIGAYGDGPRPSVTPTGSAAGFMTGLSSSPLVSHVVVQGIRFAAANRDPAAADFDPAAVANGSYGVQLYAGGTDLLVEDCAVEAFSTNVAVQGGLGSLTDVRFRRNVVVDAYADDGIHSQGFFAHDVAGLLLEQNVFDHNGWSESPAVTAVGAGRATVFNHDVYLTSSTSGIVVRGNVFADAASTGLQARSGGDVLDNLFVANPIHLDYGLVRGDSGPTPGGVSGTVNGNVFLGTRRLAGQVRGIGAEIANTRAGGPTVFSNNVFSNAGAAGSDGNGPWDAGGFAALSLVVGQGKGDAEQAAGLRDLTLQGNIVRDWAAGLSMQSSMRPNAAGTNGYSGLVVKRNEFSRVSGTMVDHPAAVDGSAERWTGNRYDGAGDEKVLKIEGRSLAASDGGAVGGAGGTPAYADPDRS
ncbi:MAG: hypothetical protein JWO31_53, partial [Phycisphaerales bacterium]|nr:hypothetical protein [Phycisphaerales bacterium]